MITPQQLINHIIRYFQYVEYILEYIFSSSLSFIMMVVVTVLFLAAVVVAEKALGNELPVLGYHETVGIPTYQRIKQREQAQDFDGSRIVGGTIVGAGRHPYLGRVVIHLVGGSTSSCGSSLLTNTRAITAAHCWFDGFRQATSFVMVYGSALLHTGGVRVPTNQVVMHEAWGPWTLRNDIAIVTHSWVSYNNVINHILLPSGSDLDQNFEGFQGVASGFGLTRMGPPEPNPDKREVTLTVITNAACQQVFGSSIVVASNLCTTAPAGQNVCTGDSGGPLAIGAGNNRVLVGIVSFGAGDCTTGSPSVFTRVTSYISWIISKL